jgi:hypothetical protein
MGIGSIGWLDIERATPSPPNKRKAIGIFKSPKYTGKLTPFPLRFTTPIVRITAIETQGLSNNRHKIKITIAAHTL